MGTMDRLFQLMADKKASDIFVSVGSDTRAFQVTLKNALRQTPESSPNTERRRHPMGEPINIQIPIPILIPILIPIRSP